MSLYPCSQPQICGVRHHRSGTTCLLPSVAKAGGALSSSPIPQPSFPPGSPPVIEVDLGNGYRELHFQGANQSIQKWEMVNSREQTSNPDGGPAIIRWDDKGNMTEQVWLLDGRIHREDGPAQIKYSSSGSVESEFWYLDDTLHREGAPAITRYSGQHQPTEPTSQFYMVHGVLHREDGPAVTGGREVYALNGTEMSQERFQQYRDARDSGMTHEMSMAWIGLG